MEDWGNVSLKIRLGWPDSQPQTDVEYAEHPDASVQEILSAPHVIDACIDDLFSSDLLLIEKTVAGHFQKIIARTAPQAEEKPPGSANDMRNSEYDPNSLVDFAFASPFLVPRYLKVGAQPVGGLPENLCFLPFSTVGFIAPDTTAYIIVSNRISFRAAIISAFNSVLDLMNIVNETRAKTARHIGRQIFGGLNSQKVFIEFDGAICPGYLRKDSARYVL
ncbi:MAG: hypothetical protein HC844_16710 [Tabrizicola sp.]|nr:hypothetical protein [Tabrizicola sp.]